MLQAKLTEVTEKNYNLSENNEILHKKLKTEQ